MLAIVPTVFMYGPRRRPSATSVRHFTTLLLLLLLLPLLTWLWMVVGGSRGDGAASCWHRAPHGAQAAPPARWRVPLPSRRQLLDEPPARFLVRGGVHPGRTVAVADLAVPVNGLYASASPASRNLDAGRSHTRGGFVRLIYMIDVKRLLLFIKRVNL